VETAAALLNGVMKSSMVEGHPVAKSLVPVYRLA
jgi:hypothetical protein